MEILLNPYFWLAWCSAHIAGVVSAKMQHWTKHLIGSVLALVFIYATNSFTSVKAVPAVSGISCVSGVSRTQNDSQASAFNIPNALTASQVGGGQ